MQGKAELQLPSSRPLSVCETTCRHPNTLFFHIVKTHQSNQQVVNQVVLHASRPLASIVRLKLDIWCRQASRPQILQSSFNPAHSTQTGAAAQRTEERMRDVALGEACVVSHRRQMQLPQRPKCGQV
jgi:hypothetical protein